MNYMLDKHWKCKHSFYFPEQPSSNFETQKGQEALTEFVQGRLCWQDHLKVKRSDMQLVEINMLAKVNGWRFPLLFLLIASLSAALEVFTFKKKKKSFGLLNSQQILNQRYCRIVQLSAGVCGKLRHGTCVLCHYTPHKAKLKKKTKTSQCAILYF